MPGTNALTYFETSSLTAVKSFKTLAPDENSNRYFKFLQNENASSFARGGSTVVGHSTHNTKVGGSSPLPISTERLTKTQVC
jgi:hypothetical protein